jgi:hypothetical protein
VVNECVTEYENTRITVSRDPVLYYSRSYEVILRSRSERGPSQARPVGAIPCGRPYWSAFFHLLCPTGVYHPALTSLCTQDEPRPAYYPISFQLRTNSTSWAGPQAMHRACRIVPRKWVSNIVTTLTNSSQRKTLHLSRKALPLRAHRQNQPPRTGSKLVLN